MLFTSRSANFAETTFREQISHGGLKVVGIDAAGEAPLVELTTHRFFIATLFLPQLSSSAARPHPLIVAYLKAAQNFQATQHRNTVKRKIEQKR